MRWRPPAPLGLTSPTLAWPSRTQDRNGHLLRFDHGIEQLVVGITEHELQGVLTGSQIELRLRLAPAKVEVLLVRRNWLVRVQLTFGIQKQMVVADIGRLITGPRHAHVG